MFTFKKPPTNIALILAGLFFILIFSYTITSFLQEQEISDPTLTPSSKTVFHPSAEATHDKKPFISDSILASIQKKELSMGYRNSEPKRIKIPPRPISKIKGISSSEIKDAQSVANSISGYKDLESVFMDEYDKDVQARKRKARRKREIWRKGRIRAGYPDPFRKKKKKRKRKKTEEQIMKETYAEYIDDRGKALLKKYQGSP